MKNLGNKFIKELSNRFSKSQNTDGQNTEKQSAKGQSTKEQSTQFELAKESPNENKQIVLKWQYLIIYLLIAILISILLVQCKAKKDMPNDLAGAGASNEVVNVTNRKYTDNDKEDADSRDVPGTIGDNYYGPTSETLSESTTATTKLTSTTKHPSSNTTGKPTVEEESNRPESTEPAEPNEPSTGSSESTEPTATIQAEPHSHE